MRRNIVLVGEMGAGKDMVASLLPNHTRRAFGDYIRMIAGYLRGGEVVAASWSLRKLFKENCPPNLLEKCCEWAKIPKPDNKDRALLQEVGTWCRQRCDEIWINAVLDHILPTDGPVVITDCRRRIELAACKARGFLSVAVEAVPEVRTIRLIERDGTFREEWLKHEAEREVANLMISCDLRVRNNGTIEDLLSQLRTRGLVNE